MPLPGQPIRARVKIGRSADDCWTWLGPTSNAGHGKITFCGRDELAHRWMWEQLFGPIPGGLVVYSTCESKSCINPHHLACGTQASACRSSVQTKLLPADVAEIKAAKTTASANTARFLGEKYGISPSLIRDIWAGRAWARSKKFHGPRQPRNQHPPSPTTYGETHVQ